MRINLLRLQVESQNHLEPGEPEDVHIITLMVDTTNGFNDRACCSQGNALVGASQMGCVCSVFIQLLPTLSHAHSVPPMAIPMYSPLQRGGDTGGPAVYFSLWNRIAAHWRGPTQGSTRSHATLIRRRRHHDGTLQAGGSPSEDQSS